MKRSLLAILITFLVLLIVIVIAYKNKQIIQKDDAANWKTYTNTKYGFEFKYPNNWAEQKSNSQDEFKIDISEDDPQLPTYRSITGKVVNNTKSLSPKDYANVNKENEVFHVYSTEELKKLFSTSLPEQPIYGYTIPGECGGDQFYIAHNKNIIELKVDCYPSSDITNTFKFTK